MPLHDIATELRHALRATRRSPSFAAMAILTLGLGIGLSTAVLTVSNALLLRPLAVRDQDRVVLLWGETPDGRFADVPLGYSQARDFARRTRVLSRVAFVTYEGAWPVPMRDAGRIFPLRRSLVSGNFFEVLGTRALIGRGLQRTDDVVGAAPVMVLSYGGWQRAFGGDPAVVGRHLTLQLDGIAYTVVGVMPKGLEYPAGADCWEAVAPGTSSPGRDSVVADVNLVGRLAPGATLGSARAELSAFFQTTEARWHIVHGVVHTLPRVVLGDTRPALFVFLAAGGLLLLITCINVANLLLVRGLVRAREIAVRGALGAGRDRIVAQLVAENVVLAIAGGVVGVALAAAVVKLFVAVAPAEVPRLDEIRLNGTAVAGATAITTLAMLLFGLVPALVASRTNLLGAVRSGERRSASRRSRMATQALVAGQSSLAVVVLAASGLLVNSYVRLSHADLRLEPSHLLIAEPSLRFDIYNDLPKQLAVIDQMMSALRALPGVRAASPVVAVPFSGNGGWDGQFRAEGQSPAQARSNPIFNTEVVAPAYFETLGIPIVRGRGFTDDDRPGAANVVMLSESAARAFWPGEDPIGRRVVLLSKDQIGTVVGIVPDTRYRDLRDARPSIYFPLRQSRYPYAPLTLAIRTAGEPAALGPALRRALSAVAPGVGLQSVEPFETLLGRPLALPRLNALLLAIFAGAALLLAAVGLYVVSVATVRQRTRELGIRLALGASPGMLRRMVLRDALIVAAFGMAVGVGGALALSQSLRSLLFDVSPADPSTLGLALTALLVVVLVAARGPARRAAQTDPVQALRAE